MPQTRKRKTNDQLPDEADKKVQKNLTTNSSKGKVKSKEVSEISKNKLQTSAKRISSRKKNVKNALNSEAESSSERTKNKNICKENLVSSRKDPKLKKAKVVKPSVSVKDEPHDSKSFVPSLNSSDSGIMSEINDGNSAVKAEETVSEYNKSELSDKSICIKEENESDTSESEWEEVEDTTEINLDDYKPNIPEEGVEITIDCPELQIRKRKKKEFDENEWIRLYINRNRKDNQLSVHKTHLLCLLAHGIYVNKILNSDTLKALAMSIIPNDILAFTSGKKVDKIDISAIQKILVWFHDTFSIESSETYLLKNVFLSLVKNFECKNSSNTSEYNLMFIVIARMLGFKVRFCISLYPVTHKASNLIKKPNSKKSSKKSKLDDETENSKRNEPECSKTKTIKKELKTPKTEKKVTSGNKNEKKKDSSKTVTRPRRSAGKNYKISDNDDDSNDEDFIMAYDESSGEDTKKSRKSTSKKKSTTQKRQSNRKVLSSDSEPSSPQICTFKSGMVLCWAEVFLKSDKQWISVECVNNIVNKPYEIETFLPQPVSYILAIDNESYVKDITRRYCSEYMTITRKLRIDPEWWEETLEPFLPPNSKQNKEEEKKLDEILINKPLPKTIQE